MHDSRVIFLRAQCVSSSSVNEAKQRTVLFLVEQRRKKTAYGIAVPSPMSLPRGISAFRCFVSPNKDTTDSPEGPP